MTSIPTGRGFQFVVTDKSCPVQPGKKRRTLTIVLWNILFTATSEEGHPTNGSFGQ